MSENPYRPPESLVVAPTKQIGDAKDPWGLRAFHAALAFLALCYLSFFGIRRFRSDRAGWLAEYLLLLLSVCHTPHSLVGRTH